MTKRKMPKKTKAILKEIAADHVCPPQPTKIEYVDREVIVYKPMPTWSIHTSWFFFSVIVGAVVWAIMYPNWTK